MCQKLPATQFLVDGSLFMNIRPLTEGPDELHPMRSLIKYEDQNEHLLDYRCEGGGIKLKSKNNDFFLTHLHYYYFIHYIHNMMNFLYVGFVYFTLMLK